MVMACGLSRSWPAVRIGSYLPATGAVVIPRTLPRPQFQVAGNQEGGMSDPRCTNCGSALTNLYWRNADGSVWCLPCSDRLSAVPDELAAERQRRAGGRNLARPVARRMLTTVNTPPALGAADGGRLLPFPSRWQTSDREP
jgi:hypothetical protein